MEATAMGTLLLGAALLVGVLVGLAVGYWTFPAIREAARLRVQLDEALQEHEKYRASVDAHFRKTADLVGQMTRSYAAVYDHLATGARTFCDDGAAGSRIPFEPLPGALASPEIETAAEAVPVDEGSDPAAAPAAPEGAGPADAAAPVAEDAGLASTLAPDAAGAQGEPKPA